MKRYFFLLILLFVVCFADAQNKRNGFTPERFQAELEQYITKKACLTPKEASKFFPLYSEMSRKQRIVHQEIKKLKRIKPASESECKKNINKRDALDIQMKKKQKTYHEKFMEVLPAEKVYDILKAEDRFHRQMFKRKAARIRNKK